MLTTTKRRRPSRRRNSPWRLLFTLALGFSLGLAGHGVALAKGEKKQTAKSQGKPLHEQGYQDIIKKYSLVADFSPKDSYRPVSDEVFWRYPLSVPKVEFPLVFDLDPKTELPPTKGQGRAVDHLNRGRIKFLEGAYNEARATWLSGRARFGREYPFHRRNDYFIGTSFFHLGKQKAQSLGNNMLHPEVKIFFENAATFFSWAFVVKVDQPDALADLVTPKGLYNMSAIYWQYGRHAGAFGAAANGLNFLRKTGRKEYRPQFARISAEAHIKNRTYQEAVQILDQSIRQDQSREQAAAAFARIGDIYFDLNNYELAEDVYALAAALDEELRQVSSSELVLRGESLFWLGKFSEAQSTLHQAMHAGSYRQEKAPLSKEFRAWASLRIADAYLARKMIDQARLEYYRVGRDFREFEAGRIAKLRAACLELPFYSGKNVNHARNLLEEYKEKDLPSVAVELGWSCQVASYTARERSEDMLRRVGEFYKKYPDSRFLKQFEDPVREFQAEKINPFLGGKDDYRAVSFFEKNRKTLYPTLSEELAVEMFNAYADIGDSSKAKEFWDAAKKHLPTTDLNMLRMATVAFELSRKGGAEWQARNQRMAKDLENREWNLEPDDKATAYVRRFLATEAYDEHVPWLKKLARHWSKANRDFSCDLELPLLARAHKANLIKVSIILQQLTVMIDEKLPELFKRDQSCALTMLELEQDILRRTSDAGALGLKGGVRGSVVLAERYLKRSNWALVGDYLHLFWTVAEHIHEDGDSVSATRMWEMIRDKADAQAPEAHFARARLDPTVTELEQLWN